jgi:hypothetical protein
MTREATASRAASLCTGARGRAFQDFLAVRGKKNEKRSKELAKVKKVPAPAWILEKG